MSPAVRPNTMRLPSGQPAPDGRDGCLSQVGGLTRRQQLCSGPADRTANRWTRLQDSLSFKNHDFNPFFLYRFQGR
jgi:hypothetical protein